MLEIQANDAYAYARRLLDFLFSKEEQKKSLVHSSLKSKKPQLDQGRMSKLFGELPPVIISDVLISILLCHCDIELWVFEVHPKIFDQ